MSTALIRGRQAREQLVPPVLTLATGRQHTAETILRAWRESKTANTIRSYEHDLEDFAQFFSRALNIYPRISIEQCLDRFFRQSAPSAHETTLFFRGHLEQCGMAPSTINRHMAALRSLSKLARMLGVTTWVLETPGVKAEKRKDTRGPTVADIRRMLAARSSDSERDTRDAAAVTLIYCLGLRASELCGLKYEECDLDNRRCWIRGKGRREREPMPLPDAAITAIRRYLPHRGTSSGPLIQTRGTRGKNGNGALETRSLTRIIRKLGEEVGIRCWPHAIRHSSITTAITRGSQRGIGLAQTRAYSRHASVVTLTGYFDDHDREQTQRTLTDLVADSLNP